MNFLFGNKQQVQSLAQVLEDGRDRMNDEMMIRQKISWSSWVMNLLKFSNVTPS